MADFSKTTQIRPKGRAKGGLQTPWNIRPWQLPVGQFFKYKYSKGHIGVLEAYSTPREPIESTIDSALQDGLLITLVFVQ